MATLTSNFQTLSDIEEANTEKNNTLPALEGLMNGMLDGFLDDLGGGLYNPQVSASSLSAYTADGRLTASGSFSSLPITITSIKYQNFYTDSTLSMSGSVRGDQSLNISGSITRMVYSSPTLSFSIAGQISMTNTDFYTMKSISVSYVVGDVTYTEVITGNMEVSALTGLVTGTVTSFYMGVMDDSGSRYIKASNFTQDAALFFNDFSTVEEVMEIALDGADTIQGDGSNQDIHGYAGNDRLISGGAATAMYGGAGDDTYVVNDVADTVIEDADEGTDLVQVLIATAGGSYTLGANVESGILLNKVVYNLSGNDLNNVLTGNAAANVLDGGDGNDTLNGGAGADTLIGGGGDDTYVIDNAGDIITEADGEGNDTVQSSNLSIDLNLAKFANIENATLTGSATLNLTGNSDDNWLTGNAGANLIDGGEGADEMIGGAGNDTYIVDDAGDTVTEQLKGGTDTVKSSVNFTLGTNVENLTLTGSANLDATGNDAANTILGNTGNNVIDGGDGVDVLAGGAGDDTYMVDLAASGSGARMVVKLQDSVTERLNEGDDTIVLRGSPAPTVAKTLVLGANLEHLDASDTGSTKLNLTGNTAANILTGNDANNILNGGAGADTLIGGEGDDTYVVDNANDLIEEEDGDGTDTVLLAATTAFNYELSEFVENAKITSTVAAGLIGNDTDNTLTGNAAANLLDGGAGEDTLIGGAGNDTYVIDSDGDNIVEAAAGGVDTVKLQDWTGSLNYLLGNFLENVTLTGNDDINVTGNALANILIGNDGANELAGAAGNDTYYISTGDTVVEAVNAGVDKIVSDISYDLGDAANVENLTLAGSANLDATGNELANILTGNDGVNWLDGAGGKDRLIGGKGDDFYWVDVTSAGKLEDTVTELAGAGSGNDTLLLRGAITAQTATITLGGALANLENINASSVSSATLNLTGNAAANTLIGNGANNTLSGGAGADYLDGGSFGNDTLIGGAGSDIFAFRFFGNGNADIIKDFTSGDIIALDLATFDVFGSAGALDASMFHAGAGAVAQDSNDHLIYNTTTGQLFYDADGNGAGSSELIATLSNKAQLTASDFEVFSA